MNLENLSINYYNNHKKANTLKKVLYCYDRCYWYNLPSIFKVLSLTTFLRDNQSA